MIFSDSPQQKALERMMTTVPNFRPRGSGVMVLHNFEYTAEMCDCRLCLYYNRKRKSRGCCTSPIRWKSAQKIRLQQYCWKRILVRAAQGQRSKSDLCNSPDAFILSHLFGEPLALPAKERPSTRRLSPARPGQALLRNLPCDAHGPATGSPAFIPDGDLLPSASARACRPSRRSGPLVLPGNAEGPERPQRPNPFLSLDPFCALRGFRPPLTARAHP